MLGQEAPEPAAQPPSGGEVTDGAVRRATDTPTGNLHMKQPPVLSVSSNPLVPEPASGTSDEYSRRRAAIEARDARPRRVPAIPPRERQLRVVIDTDAGNEIDDLWALALALRCPERFQIEGFVAANYDNHSPGGGPGSLDTSARLIETVVAQAGLAGKFPVKRGSPPMRYQFEPSESEGVDFLIERAMASTAEDPLWVVGLGAATDIASAYLKEPRIVERVVVFWHFRTEWPKRCWNFNVIGDVRAARLVFHSDLAFVLFDTGTDLTCPMEQSAQWVEYGPLGRFLHEYRLRSEWYQDPKKGFYDLGDLASLVEPSLATWEVVACPEVNWDLAYAFNGTKGEILRCGAIDRDRTFALLEERLRNS
ncbi:MAG: hypothetical protein COY42_16155 [Armatimonadetes bacterium CG_4_10_14_0_8_um_filter_66_14]|nr:MAG: hypothetical protein COZ57_16435 [Armatimonadetes bacterium CG_4_8_14_3_um_filter_66_20]PIZ43221.1 MAG: hypothetical protein COY42_16155 [Armatimonadetes bacterium CG_4_10_14_0_8_um_filter_66_14]PJB72530.1 MAG: hypothetical protein CO096_07610 [Armatimonadetes bacterium CG_4_9_14_3_um_filter_66_14]